MGIFMLLEICTDSLLSIENAIKGGAHRVELCQALCEGGTTPSYALIKKARDLCKDIKLNVMIRARGGSFYYDESEIEIMLLDIKECVKIGVDGLVFGALDENGLICKKVNKILLNETQNIPCTYHRAFDVVQNKFDAIFDVIDLGFSRILTSGFEKTAKEGEQNLKLLQDMAKDKIIIMAGSGINEDNIVDLYKNTNINEFHGSFSSIVSDKSIYRQDQISFSASGFNDYEKKVSSALKIQKALDNLNLCFKYKK